MITTPSWREDAMNQLERHAHVKNTQQGHCIHASERISPATKKTPAMLVSFSKKIHVSVVTKRSEGYLTLRQDVEYQNGD